MSYQPHPAFQRLFSAYTADAASIGMQLTRILGEAAAADPLLVCTGSDMVLFPGAGRAPIVESFRRTTRGFIELAAVSHLPLAVAWLARMRELAPQDARWRDTAAGYIRAIGQVQEINTPELWRTAIGVPAWAGMEEKIADLVEYSCRATAAVLEAALREESGFTFERLRGEYLEPAGSSRVPVPMNDVMFATFALTFLDIGQRITAWLRARSLVWGRLMVLISGRSGRPTAGLTRGTNNLCHLICRAARGHFDVRRLLIAPHAPALDLAAAADPERSRSLEQQFRDVWFNTRASVEMASRIFEGFPPFEPAEEPVLYVSPADAAVNRLPTARTVYDRYALMSRMRVVLEDPQQLLSNVAADYVIDQLAQHDNDPSKVFIEGFTNADYAAARRAQLPGTR